MNCLIVEDEKVAAERLSKLIKQYDAGIEILAVTQSIVKSVGWFHSHDVPDLVFMDIQLADGLSFEIFEQIDDRFPVIFTTAYDEYALRAFKLNSIDYLLKPVSPDELHAAIDKFKRQNRVREYPGHVFESILQSLTNKFKSKFVIRVGEHIRVIPAREIQCFYSMDKAVFLQNRQGRDYAVNYSLDQLEELLDPEKFFRISRKYLVAFESIKDIISYSNSRLLLRLETNASDDLIVSRERVQKFRQWLEE
ncbi:MAG: LytTR family DNA-binding domain-containing protein [Bacteroidales bacterium]|jgi:DNA-binding LytR/AlgR family response regulator